MSTPLAEVLTHLRVGNQKFLVDFYQQRRPLFERWAQQNHQLNEAAAHKLLQGTLLDFYDQVADGRLTLLPPNLPAHIYDMAQQRLAAAVPALEPLPAAEASRRQHLLALFHALAADCHKVLTYAYFYGYNSAKMGAKMGFANATVARIQKSNCLQKFLEQAVAADASLLANADQLERFADGELTASEQQAFEHRLETEPELADNYATFEQFTADLRWAAGHDTLRQRLHLLDHRMNQRGLAVARSHRRAWQQRRRWIWGLVSAGLLVVALLVGRWWMHRPSAASADDWEAYYQPDPGPQLPSAVASTRPLFYDAVTQYQAGHYPAALHTLGRLTPPELGADSILYFRGIFLLRGGEGAAAQPYLRRLSEEGQSADLARRSRYHLGMAYWQAQELREALTVLRQVAADSLNPYRQSARRVVAAKVLEPQK